MTPDIQSLRDKAKAAVEGLAAYRANPNINTSKTSMLATAQFKKAAGDPILILSLIEALEKAERELGEVREAALEEAAVAAEAWEPVEKLLPLCDADANEAAMTGQWEARERIVDAIRDLRRAARTLETPKPRI